MQVYQLNWNNINIIANFMAELKPEWWDKRGAAGQLSSGIGWYFGDSKNRPAGWLLCKSLDLYRTCELECLGFNDNGSFKIGQELQPLIEEAENWARGKNFSLMRFTIGSRGLSCHLRKLNIPWEELKDIHAVDREEFNWFLRMGYIPSGVLPDIYGENYHGIMLVKRL